jgi:hypothetical protein
VCVCAAVSDCEPMKGIAMRINRKNEIACAISYKNFVINHRAQHFYLRASTRELVGGRSRLLMNSIFPLHETT